MRGGEWQGEALENYNANNVIVGVLLPDTRARINLFYPSVFFACRGDDTKTVQTNRHTLHTPFLEEMSLARSSLRLARESASSSARGKAFSWGAERLCWTWDSSKVWESASRRAARYRQKTRTAAGDDATVRLRGCCLCRTCRKRFLPSEEAEAERWPSLRSWEERGSPKQLVHRTASTTHTHSPAVI